MTAAPTEAADEVRYAAPGTTLDLRRAGIVTVLLAVIGALLGFAWSAWAPPVSGAYILAPGVYLPGESESFIAGDGRFLVIAAVFGLIAAVVGWRDTAHRGPALVLSLVVGTLAGSYLMELVGHLTGGGSVTGPKVPGTDARQTAHLPLSLHAQGFLFVAPFVAALIYGLLIAFAVHDDLGRPDPVRDDLRRAGVKGDDEGAAGAVEAGSVEAGSVESGSVESGSVETGDQLQDAGRDGDAARAAQQGDLPPQQPRDPY